MKSKSQGRDISRQSSSTSTGSQYSHSNTDPLSRTAKYTQNSRTRDFEDSTAPPYELSSESSRQSDSHSGSHSGTSFRASSKSSSDKSLSSHHAAEASTNNLDVIPEDSHSSNEASSGSSVSPATF